MSRMGESFFVIEGEADSECELCGASEECRPYGPKGENVCFSCGMKDEDACRRAFAQRTEPH